MKIDKRIQRKFWISIFWDAATFVAIAGIVGAVTAVVLFTLWGPGGLLAGG